MLAQTLLTHYMSERILLHICQHPKEFVNERRSLQLPLNETCTPNKLAYTTPSYSLIIYAQQHDLHLLNNISVKCNEKWSGKSPEMVTMELMMRQRTDCSTMWREEELRQWEMVCFLDQVIWALIEASRYGGTNTLIPIQISRTVNKGVCSSREDIFGKEI